MLRQNLGDGGAEPADDIVIFHCHGGSGFLHGSSHSFGIHGFDGKWIHNLCPDSLGCQHVSRCQGVRHTDAAGKNADVRAFPQRHRFSEGEDGTLLIYFHSLLSQKPDIEIAWGIGCLLYTSILLGPFGLDLLDGSILGISGELRQIALIIILARAGLNLDVEDLRKVGRPAVLMCFVPACFEIVGMVLLAPALLGLTRLEAAVMGTVVAAVSPAVIVPRMLKLMEENRNNCLIFN